jgi:two-component system cell cycle sensor histidine kinase/response regulator CckA
VEDETAVKDLTTLMLKRQGYKVIASTSPNEAIHLAQDYTDNIHLMIVDVVMPEMTGRELADTLLHLRPGLRLLFMSGYTADVIAHHGILDGNIHFIQKPFSSKSLAFKVREALEA